MTRLLAASLCLALLVFAGCVSTRNSYSPPEPEEQADAIELWANPPVAVNWNDDPGPDGVRVSVFLYQYRGNRVTSVLIKGTLEFLMYDGRLDDTELAHAMPMQTWTYTEQELATREVRGPPGWGYATQLAWTHVPKSSRVTLVVGYRSPKGETLYSRPLVIGVPK